jgi:hypothetical protein
MNLDSGDLVVLVADICMEKTVEGLLSRPAVLGVGKVGSYVRRHPHHDAVGKRAAEFLRTYLGSFSHALVMFDREGSPYEKQSASETERKVTDILARSGWDDRAACVVIDPELEIWVWSSSPHVARCLGWKWRDMQPKEWLVSQGLWPSNSPKPDSPKECMDRVLRRAKLPRSAAIFRELSQEVNPRGCTDPSFLRFKSILQGWFPLPSTAVHPPTTS